MGVRTRRDTTSRLLFGALLAVALLWAGSTPASASHGGSHADVAVTATASTCPAGATQTPSLRVSVTETTGAPANGVEVVVSEQPANRRTSQVVDVPANGTVDVDFAVPPNVLVQIIAKYNGQRADVSPSHITIPACAPTPAPQEVDQPDVGGAVFERPAPEVLGVQLAQTGASSLLLAVAAVSLLGLGAIAVIAGRRRAARGQ